MGCGRPVDEEGSARPSPVVAIVGPTAVGKTEMAVEVALRLGGEVISADAMQVYRGMDVGTDKPTAEQRRGVVHHLIDVVDPDTPFSAACYRALAREALRAIQSRGALAIVCGGTGLYLRAFLDDQLPAAGFDPVVRARLEQQARRHGPAELHRRLQQVDPVSAARIHPNDARRIVRALELFELTGQPLSRLQAQSRQQARPLPTVWVGLTRPREVLYRRIEQRVERQLARGLVEETRRLLARGLGPGHTALQALGYKEMARYLRGELSFAQAVLLLKRSTRKYARRQWIWFKADPRIRWFDLCAAGSWQAAVEQVVLHIRQALEAGAAAPGPQG